MSASEGGVMLTRNMKKKWGRRGEKKGGHGD